MKNRRLKGNKMQDIEKKREKERKAMELILSVYEKGHQEERDDIEKLRQYSMERINKCPKMATKTYCSNCEIHCYRQEYRDKIKKVMRYSGPRLFLKKPLWVVDHMVQGLVKKWREKESRKEKGGKR